MIPYHFSVLHLFSLHFSFLPNELRWPYHFPALKPLLAQVPAGYSQTPYNGKDFSISLHLLPA